MRPRSSSPSCSGGFQLRSRDAGKIGESIFLDKDDVWEWAVRKGLVAAPRRRARADSSDDDSDSSDEDAAAAAARAPRDQRRTIATRTPATRIGAAPRAHRGAGLP